MASLLGSRRRAEQFAALVDGHVRPDDLPADVRELVDVVASVRAMEAPAPRPEFSTALREQLMTQAQEELVAASPLALQPRRRGTRERRLTAAAAVFTLVGGTAGLAVAAQESLPGEALYPLKRGLEDAQLSVEDDPAARGRAYLDQAQSRLDETVRLVEDGAPTVVVEDTVDVFVVQTVAGADLLLGSGGATPAEADVEVLRQFAAGALAQVQDLAAESEVDEILDDLARAGVVLQRIDQQAASACADCSSLPPLELPTLMAQTTEISRAMAAVRNRDLGNDHPALDGPSAPSDGAGSAPSTAAGPGGDDPRVDVDGSAGLPPDAGKALEPLDDAIGGLLHKVTRGTSDPRDTPDTVREQADDLGENLDSTLD